MSSGDRRAAVVRRHLLWLDCSAAALVGATVLLLSDWLSRVQGLPQPFLVFIGAVNLSYASYSFALVCWPQRPPAAVVVLVTGNVLWASACLGFALHFWSVATIWGLGHLLIEALFVGGLARLEWRWLVRALPDEPRILRPAR